MHNGWDQEKKRCHEKKKNSRKISLWIGNVTRKKTVKI